MPRLTRAGLCLLLSDLVREHERVLARATALDRENASLRRKVAWTEEQQMRGYTNETNFTPIPPRKDAR